MSVHSFTHRLTIPLILCAIVFGGCSVVENLWVNTLTETIPEDIQSDEETDTPDSDNLLSALRKIRDIRVYESHIEGEMQIVVDGYTEWYHDLTVGEDRQTHFVRGMTIRIWKSGDVYLRATSEQGDESWVPIGKI